MDPGTSRKRSRGAMQSPPRPAVNVDLLPSSPPPALVASTSRSRVQSSPTAEQPTAAPRRTLKQSNKASKAASSSRDVIAKLETPSPVRIKGAAAAIAASRRSPRASKAGSNGGRLVKSKHNGKKQRRVASSPSLQPASSQDGRNRRSTSNEAGSELASQADVDAAKLECARLKSRLEHCEDVIRGQKATISHFYGQCSCTICMELVWRPHVLSPCGHVFCARCLIDWFERPLEHEGPLPEDLTPELRAREIRRRTLRRRKICPHCRVKVGATPAEVWMVKGLLETIEKSMAKGEGNEDHLVEGMAAEQGLTGEQRRNARGENLASGGLLWKDIFDTRIKDGIVYDDTEGILRCGVCACEVLHGMCVNQNCGAVYSDFEEHDAEGDDLDDSEMERQYGGGSSLDGDEDDEENSFIDDGDANDVAALHHYGGEIDSDDDDDHHDEDGIDMSDDEVQEVDADGRPTGHHPHDRIVIAPSDSESDGSGIRFMGVPRRWAARPPRVLLDEDDEVDEHESEHDEDGFPINEGDDEEDDAAAAWSDQSDDGGPLTEAESDGHEAMNEDPDYQDDHGGEEDDHEAIEWVPPHYLDAYPLDSDGENDAQHAEDDAHAPQADPLEDYAAYQGYLHEDEGEHHHAADSDGESSLTDDLYPGTPAEESTDDEQNGLEDAYYYDDYEDDDAYP